jgi:quinol monooxygenase YgiN
VTGVIVQIVKASIRPEKRDTWLEVVGQNAERSRAEAGCQGYQVAEDLEAPNNFIIVELWADMESLHVHLRNQFEGIMSSLGDSFAAPPEAFVYEVSSTLSLQDVLAAAGVGQ